MASLYDSCFPNEGNAAKKKSEQAYKNAIEAAYIMWPELKEQELVPWRQFYNRPFLRAYHGLASVQSGMGKGKESLENFRFLLRANPCDNQGVRGPVFHKLIGIGEYKEAEQIAEKHSDGRNSTEAVFLFGFILIDFLKHKLGYCSQKDLEESMVKALRKNSYVIPLLLTKQITEPSDCITAHSMDEAKNIVFMMTETTQRLPGTLEWLEGAMFQSGIKPDDDGAILFALLQKYWILVGMKNGEKIVVTSNVDAMPGRGLRSFRLASGMKEHNPDKIVAFQYGKKECDDDNFLNAFVSFPYDKVKSIPFWKMLHAARYQ
eukprot:CAMPEP_0168180354 /NCGR_PEP_ID=MMETSP0139_2-20121125/10470_1 /TAXON_ID=44445 /ORGANISM="Pseudo-nitzschia australis, Strain 10249 10 AB" /LENGTH=318 /DNA_ID=CAMNT_0008100521 /DNA_START=353 /DNA_END=1309 /DNA_ORIENTATION=-